MEFNAFKMDGLGNDFVIIDQRDETIDLTKEQIVKICNRDFIGCDQLIYIENSKVSDASMKFFNSDGSTSGACGNGTRCVAYLVAKEKNVDHVNLNVGNNFLNSKILSNNQVQTTIGKPKLNWKDIPLLKDIDTKNLNITISDINNNSISGGVAVNVGNPHVIFFVPNLNDYNLKDFGPSVENHKIFPEKSNVTLAQKINDKHIKVKVWERGAGLTKACGTAACATAVAANLNKLQNSITEIEFSLGKLEITIDQETSIHMKGPVSEIEKILIKI